MRSQEAWPWPRLELDNGAADQFAPPASLGSHARAAELLAANGLRIVEAGIAHVYALAANLRRQEIEAAALIGRDPKSALRISFRSSRIYRRVVLAGDDVIAMWGLTGDTLSDVGFPFMITSTRAAKFKRALVTTARAEVEHMATMRRVLVDYVPPDDYGAARFLEHLGFQFAGEGPQLAGSGRLWFRYEYRSG